ncbi:SDR family oxidoreductase [Microbacterium sp. Sa4CUA7]|uniref:SDR family oxidoreductase n=1 Tax=Microbacterium pullorum TaxID=2762236 RepID=A0ABR8S2K7_9MICO|nr:SDR family oxidoreductase [Microbacterium pullorum]MBD7957723.1 SDR family oxidoreductase [Microbacterium pullorum]
MSAELDGLVAVVTGGASGIGFATASQLRERGANVAVLDRAIDTIPTGAVGIVCDVGVRASVDSAIDEVARQLGGIDIVVNNVGISSIGTIEDADDDEWARVLDINVISMARVTAAALPWLRRSPAASVINLSSVAALNGLPQRAVYSATKGAVMSLTFAMAADHIADGIRINCVRPATVATAFVERMLQNFPDPAAERAALDARQATGRMVTPEEVADAIAFLASPRSGSITGTALDIDGGMTHLRPRAVQQTH